MHTLNLFDQPKQVLIMQVLCRRIDECSFAPFAEVRVKFCVQLQLTRSLNYVFQPCPQVSIQWAQIHCRFILWHTSCAKKVPRNLRTLLSSFWNEILLQNMSSAWETRFLSHSCKESAGKWMWRFYQTFLKRRPKMCLNFAVHKHKHSNMCLCLCFSCCV